MDHIHGKRTTPLYHELSPLDQAIHRYSELANKHYASQAKLDPNAPPDVKLKRERELKKALDFLEDERRITEVMVVVQAKLEEYREQGRLHKSTSAGLRVLSAEKHHPVGKLEEFMRASNDPKPSSAHTAHHIVPGKGKTTNSSLARFYIHQYGIRINDPDNGVWLVGNKKDVPHWSMDQQKAHSQIHTHNYEAWINTQVRKHATELGLRNHLKLVGRMLQQDKQPPEVGQPPNPDWDGE